MTAELIYGIFNNLAVVNKIFLKPAQQQRRERESRRQQEREQRRREQEEKRRLDELERRKKEEEERRRAEEEKRRVEREQVIFIVTSYTRNHEFVHACS